VAGWDGTALCLSPEGDVLLNWRPLGAWTRITTDGAGLIYLAGTNADVHVYAFPTAVEPTTWSAIKTLLD
jgi:hypothetical protein